MLSPGAFLVSSLSEKISGFTSDTYEAVTGLAYDTTNKKLGLKVGADTVIPFNSGLGNWKQVSTNTVGDDSGTLYSIAGSSDKTKLIKININKYGNDFIATIYDNSGLTINKTATSSSVSIVFLLHPGYNVNLSYKWSSSWDRNSCNITVFENELQLEL